MGALLGEPSCPSGWSGSIEASIQLRIIQCFALSGTRPGLRRVPLGRRGSLRLEFTGYVAVVDPAVGFFHSNTQRYRGLPIQIFADQRVVAVAPIDAQGRAEIVLAR